VRSDCALSQFSCCWMMSFYCLLVCGGVAWHFVLFSVNGLCYEPTKRRRLCCVNPGVSSGNYYSLSNRPPVLSIVDWSRLGCTEIIRNVGCFSIVVVGNKQTDALHSQAQHHRELSAGRQLSDSWIVPRRCQDQGILYLYVILTMTPTRNEKDWKEREYFLQLSSIGI